jgi:hypothetical protein
MVNFKVPGKCCIKHTTFVLTTFTTIQGTIPDKFPLIWFTGFRKEDLTLEIQSPSRGGSRSL